MSTTELTATIHGKPVPLEECGWFMREQCGCIIAALIADQRPHTLYATAEQAHDQLSPHRQDWEKDTHLGRTVEPITMTHYHKHIGANWECPQHSKKNPQ